VKQILENMQNWIQKKATYKFIAYSAVSDVFCVAALLRHYNVLLVRIHFSCFPPIRL